MRTSFAQPEIAYLPKKESRIKRAMRAFALSILVLAVIAFAGTFYVSTIKLGAGLGL
jgi:hypothetical protein